MKNDRKKENIPNEIKNELENKKIKETIEETDNEYEFEDGLNDAENELEEEYKKEMMAELELRKIREEEKKKFAKVKMEDVERAFEVLEHFLAMTERAENIMARIKKTDNQLSPQEQFINKMLSGLTK